MLECFSQVFTKFQVLHIELVATPIEVNDILSAFPIHPIRISSILVLLVLVEIYLKVSTVRGSRHHVSVQSQPHLSTANLHLRIRGVCRVVSVHIGTDLLNVGL